jgi:hypothetical protein
MTLWCDDVVRGCTCAPSRMDDPGQDQRSVNGEVSSRLASYSALMMVPRPSRRYERTRRYQLDALVVDTLFWLIAGPALLFELSNQSYAFHIE